MRFIDYVDVGDYITWTDNELSKDYWDEVVRVENTIVITKDGRRFSFDGMLLGSNGSIYASVTTRKGVDKLKMAAKRNKLTNVLNSLSDEEFLRFYESSFKTVFCDDVILTKLVE